VRATLFIPDFFIAVFFIAVFFIPAFLVAAFLGATLFVADFFRAAFFAATFCAAVDRIEAAFLASATFFTAMLLVRVALVRAVAVAFCAAAVEALLRSAARLRARDFATSARDAAALTVLALFLVALPVAFALPVAVALPVVAKAAPDTFTRLVAVRRTGAFGFIVERFLAVALLALAFFAPPVFETDFFPAVVALAGAAAFFPAVAALAGAAAFLPLVAALAGAAAFFTGAADAIPPSTASEAMVSAPMSAHALALRRANE